MQPNLKKYSFHFKKSNTMLIIDVKDSENIDKALKKYKKKFEKAGILKQLRKRKQFTKPSIIRRTEVLKAVYVEHTYRNVKED